MPATTVKTMMIWIVRPTCETCVVAKNAMAFSAFEESNCCSCFVVAAEDLVQFRVMNEAHIEYNGRKRNAGAAYGALSFRYCVAAVVSSARSKHAGFIVTLLPRELARVRRCRPRRGRTASRESKKTD